MNYLHFRILQELPGGNFGTVYKAVNEETNREVALKIVKRGWDEDAMRRQQAEYLGAELQKRVMDQDRRVTPIYSCGFGREGHLFIEMEFVDGNDIAELIRRGPLPPPQVAQIGQLAVDIVKLVSSF